MNVVNCVVVTYNRLTLLQECIEALLTQTYPINKIIVVNNASNDGTFEYLTALQASHSSLVDIVNLPCNMGGACGFNKGIRHSMEVGCDWIWIMDDDTIPYPDALENLVAKSDIVKNTGFLYSRVFYTDGTIHKMNIGGLPGQVHDVSCFQFIDEGIMLTNGCSFVSCLIKSSVVSNVGLPIKEFFIWTDDIEYTTRITKNGFFGVFVPASKVTHKTKVNSGSDTKNAKPDAYWRFFYQQRNELYMDRKSHSTFWFYRVWFKNTVKRCRECLKNKNGDRMRLLWFVLKGRIAGLFFNPSIERVDS